MMIGRHNLRLAPCLGERQIGDDVGQLQAVGVRVRAIVGAAGSAILDGQRGAEAIAEGLRVGEQIELPVGNRGAEIDGIVKPGEKVKIRLGMSGRQSAPLDEALFHLQRGGRAATADGDMQFGVAVQQAEVGVGARVDLHAGLDARQIGIERPATADDRSFMGGFDAARPDGGVVEIAQASGHAAGDDIRADISADGKAGDGAGEIEIAVAIGPADPDIVDGHRLCRRGGQRRPHPARAGQRHRQTNRHARSTQRHSSLPATSCCLVAERVTGW